MPGRGQDFARWPSPRMVPVPQRLVVLISGTGSLLQSLIDAVASGHIAADILLVVSDNADAYGLRRAEAAGIPTAVVAPAGDRAAWNIDLRDTIAAVNPDWIVSAGFMRIIGAPLLDAYEGRILNTHPALLPAFPGAHGVRDALAYGVRVTGCTVHLVDKGVDTGAIIAQGHVDVLDDDDEESLHERIKVVERDLIVEVVRRLADGAQLSIEGRRVTIS